MNCAGNCKLRERDGVACPPGRCDIAEGVRLPVHPPARLVVPYTVSTANPDKADKLVQATFRELLRLHTIRKRGTISDKTLEESTKRLRATLVAAIQQPWTLE